MMRTAIIVKFDLEGFHQWPDAPERYKPLRSIHGHVFHFECYIPVSTSRQLEFLDVRRKLLMAVRESYGTVGEEPCDFRSLSCEQLAVSIARTISNIWNISPLKVVVMEDRFVGAEVTYV